MKSNIKKTFENIYQEESDAIFRFCLVRVSNRDQALDIVQETFLRFWQSLQKGQDIQNNRAFLFTVAHRLIIDWYRKKKSIPFRDINNSDFQEEETDYDPDDEMTASLIEMKAEGRYLLDKINELSANYRHVVYLRFVEDLSPPEIGDIIGISANAVSVRINRGLDELRKKFGDKVENE